MKTNNEGAIYMDVIKVSKLDFDKFKLVDSSSGESVEYSLKDLLKVNEDNYQQEFLNQASKYVYWQAVLQNLKVYQEGVQREAEIQHANSYNIAYNYLKNTAKMNRPTKDMIESIIMRDKDYQDKLIAVEDSSESVGLINAIVKALEQRKDMLIQYGADQRNQNQNSIQR